MAEEFGAVEIGQGCFYLAPAQEVGPRKGVAALVEVGIGGDAAQIGGGTVSEDRERNNHRHLPGAFGLAGVEGVAPHRHGHVEAVEHICGSTDTVLVPFAVAAQLAAAAVALNIIL